MNSTEFLQIQNLIHKKLLNGTFTDKVIQIGAAGGQVLRLGVAATDAGTLGTYQIYSANESLDPTVYTCFSSYSIKCTSYQQVTML